MARVMLAVSLCCSHGWPCGCGVAGAGWGLVVHEEQYSNEKRDKMCINIPMTNPEPQTNKQKENILNIVKLIKYDLL